MSKKVTPKTWAPPAPNTLPTWVLEYCRTKQQSTASITVDFNSDFRLEPSVPEMRKKTQHGVVVPENRCVGLRDRTQSIGDGFNTSKNAPVARSAPHSLGERSD